MFVAVLFPCLFLDKRTTLNRIRFFFLTTGHILMVNRLLPQIIENTLEADLSGLFCSQPGKIPLVQKKWRKS